MDYKPNDLFVGIIDLFAVLLPGAVFCFVYGHAAPAAWKSHWFGIKPPEWELAAALLVASYLFGQFIFQLGSKLDKLYNRARNKRFRSDDPLLYRARAVRNAVLAPEYQVDEDTASLLEQKGMPAALIAGLLQLKGEPRRSESEFADRLRETGLWAQLTPAQLLIVQDCCDATVINTFQWAKAMAVLSSAGALTEIERLEASSKFSRSLVVVIPLVAPVLAMHENFWVAIAWCAALALIGFMSYFRYLDQRRKSVQHAYYYLIAMDLTGKKTAASAAIGGPG